MHTRYIAAIIVSLLMLVACGRPDVSAGAGLPTPVPASVSAQTTPTGAALSSAGSTQAEAPPVSEAMIAAAVERESSVSYLFVHSLKERVATARLIVLAEVRETGEVINNSRNVEDITRPATDSFSVGQVYRAQVSRYLKGSGPDSINIINREGGLSSVDAASVTPEYIAQLQNSGVFPRLQIGQSYLFFLEPFTGVDFPGT
jgi:hypothetical protein